MGGCQSSSSRQSKELRKSIKEIQNLYKEKRDQLLHNISEVEKILQQIHELEKKTSTGEIAAIATLATGATLAVISAPLTGGASLAALALGASAGISGAAAGLGVNATHKTERKQAKEKWHVAETEFKCTVKKLETLLNNVKTICEKQRQSNKDVNNTKLLHELEVGIQKLKGQMEFQQRSGIEEVSMLRALDEMKTVQNELDNIMTLFECTLRRLNYE
ncbi:hypothetical protein NL108_015849 [Boleophthalmus pectinirostris]|nr:hypothetical protein NL108_015849 [Boleophthalmus pectinirostris]